MALKDRQPGAPLWRLAFYEVIRGAARLILKFVFSAKAIDTDNIPRTGPLLMVANHQSYLDPPTIGSLVPHRHLEFLGRASLFRFKPFAWLISLLNTVPIQDDTGDSAAIREILRRLEAGRAVLIFPEGSRSPDGLIHEFKRGAALVVRRAKCPVQPVAISGAFDRWPIRGKVRFTGPPIRVKYGKVIPYEELMKDGPDKALDRLRAEVVTLWEDLQHATKTADAEAPAANSVHS